MDERGSPNCCGLRSDERSGDRAEKRRRLSRQPTIQPEIAKETIERHVIRATELLRSNIAFSSVSDSCDNGLFSLRLFLYRKITEKSDQDGATRLLEESLLP